MAYFRPIIQATIISIIITIVFGKHECNACFDGGCYSKTIVFNKYPLSGQIAIDRNNNIIYFHYEDEHSIDYTAGFDLDDIRFKIIPGIGFSFARTVDQDKGDVYVGGTQGIYKYSPVLNKTIPIGLFDKTIWHLQFQNKIYYTVFMKKGLFTYENKKSKGIRALSNYSIDDFVVTKNSDIYFLSDSRVYQLESGASHAILFLDIAYYLYTSGDDNVYFIQPASRGLYVLNTNTDQWNEVGAIDSGIPFRFVFDANSNVIYYDKLTETLYYLSPNYGRCRVARTADKTLTNGRVKHNETITLNIHKIF